MSMMNEENFTCPNCKHVQKCIIYSSMNVTENPELKELFFSDKWNIFSCEECGVVVPFSDNMMYHDMIKKFVVWYKTDDEEISKELVQMFNRSLGEDNYMSNPIIVSDRIDAIFMAKLCDTNGVPKNEEEINHYYKLIEHLKNAIRESQKQ